MLLILFIYFFEVTITNNNFVNDDKRSYKVPKIVKYHTECDISFLVEVCIVPDAFLNNYLDTKITAAITELTLTNLL